LFLHREQLPYSSQVITAELHIALRELLWSVSNLEDITMLGSEKAIAGAIAILVLGIVAAVLLG
jgi:hypothetical protein